MASDGVHNRIDGGTVTTLGIDIGGTAIKVALRTDPGSDQAGEPAAGVSAEYARPDRHALIHAITEAVSSLPNAALGQVTGVGLCVPGRRSPDGGSIELAVNVPGLVGYRFADLIGDALGRSAPFVLLSDAEAATLDVASEHPDASRVLGIAIGTGVGVALVEDGRSVTIGAGGAGHIGQIDVGPIGDGHRAGSVVGPDGGRDSLEAYLGLPALRARFGDALADRIAALPDDDPAMVALVRAIRIALAIYAPHRVVLLGGVGLALRSRGERIDALVRDGLTGVAPPSWLLAFGNSRFHAARGAAGEAARRTTSG